MTKSREAAFADLRVAWWRFLDTLVHARLLRRVVPRFVRERACLHWWLTEIKGNPLAFAPPEDD